MSLILLIVKDPNFYGSTIILQLITILFSLKNFQITILALSISYLHLRKIKGENCIKSEFQLTNSLYYKFTQISQAIPKKWKQILRENSAETCVL